MGQKKKFILLLLWSLLLMVLKFWGGFEPLELALYDHYWRQAPYEGSDSQIVVVGIDERDLQELKSYPPTNDQLADLIVAIDAQNPAVMGLDIFRDLAVTGRLAEIFQTHERLIGLGEHDGVNFPRDLLARNQVGTAEVVRKPLGKVRRVYLYSLEDGSKQAEIPHLAVKLLWWYLKSQGELVIEADERTGYLKTNGHVIPNVEKNDGGLTGDDAVNYNWLVRWRKRGGKEKNEEKAFRIVTYRDVIAGQIPPDLLKGKIVLIGYRAQSVKDILITPIGERYGVDLVAQVTSDLRSYVEDGRAIFRFIPEGVEYGLMLLVIGGAYLQYNLPTPKKKVLSKGIVQGVIVGAMLTTIYALGFWLFMKGWWIPVSQLLVSYSLTFGLVATLSHISYLKKLNKIQAEEIKQQTTELRENYQELKKAQEVNIVTARQLALSDLSRNLSHNLASYHGVLMGCSSRIPIIIKDQRPEIMRQRQELLENECELMRSSLTELQQITEQLKGIRKDSLELELSELNLEDLITETLQKAESLIVSEKIQVESQVYPIVLVTSKPLLLETILNLVVNAIDSMKTSNLKRLTLETRVEAGVLKLRISDTGVGIEPEILPKIYDPFFTTKVKGWGFGLYFVAQAMKYLKGKIEIDSQPDQGTTFTLILPLRG